MDQWRSHIPRSNSSEKFRKRSSEQRDRKLFSNEQEHELWSKKEIFLEEEEGRGHGHQVSGCLWDPQATDGVPWGVRRAPWLVASRCTPLGCVQCQKFLNIQKKKIMLNFQGILRTFIFASFYCDRKLRKQTKQDILGHLNFIETNANRK